MAEMQSTEATLNITPRMKTWILISIVLAVIGAGISIYSTVHHIAVKRQGSTDMACNINDTFSCDDVARSAYSQIGDIPLAILGLGFFAALLALLGFGVLGGKTAREHLHAYVFMVMVGVVTSLILGGLSWFAVGSLCISCMGVYAVTLVQAGTIFAFKDAIPGHWNPKELFSGLTTGAIVVALVAGAYLIADPVDNATPTAGDESIPDLPTVASTQHDMPIAKSAYAGLGEDYRAG